MNDDAGVQGQATFSRGKVAVVQSGEQAGTVTTGVSRRVPSLGEQYAECQNV